MARAATLAASLLLVATSLSVSSLSPYAGDPVTLTSSLSSTAGWGSPTGTVSFRAGSTVIGTASVDQATSQAVLSGVSFAAWGGRGLTSKHNSDDAFQGSESSVWLSIWSRPFGVLPRPVNAEGPGRCRAPAPSFHPSFGLTR